jgi:hypothetical protein
VKTAWLPYRHYASATQTCPLSYARSTGQHDLQDGLPDADGFCAYMASL